MNRQGNDKQSGKRERLNVYLQKRSTLQILKILAMFYSEATGKRVRVNDLANEALESYVREHFKINPTEAYSPGQVLELLDEQGLMNWQKVDLEEPTEEGKEGEGESGVE